MSRVWWTAATPSIPATGHGWGTNHLIPSFRTNLRLGAVPNSVQGLQIPDFKVSL